MKKFSLDQKGIAPVLLLVAALGIMGVLAITSYAPTSNKLFTSIFPKPASHAAGAVGMSLTGSSQVTPGSTFNVDVNINSFTDSVSAVELQVSFDPQKLKANSITSTGLMTVELVPGSITSNSAAITLGSSPGSAKPLNGVLAKISFTAVGTGQSSISFGNTQIAVLGQSGNQAGNLVPLTLNVAAPSPSIVPSPSATPTATPTPTSTPTPTPTLKPSPSPSKTPTPTPTATPKPSASPSLKPSPTPTATPKPSPSKTPLPTPTPTPTPSPKLGDLDGNGRVNVADLGILIRNLGRRGSNLAADLDKNGRVDFADLRILIRNFGR